MVKSDGWTPKNDALDLALEEDVDKEERSRMKMQTSDVFQGFELNISHQPAAHCENGAISTMLRYYGIEMSEPMIFGLASGLFFTHLSFIKMGGMPVTSFRTFPGVLFMRITKLLGIKSKTRRFFSRVAAMQKLDEILLKQHKPVGCVVGMYELPYMPPEYRFRFNGHNICVTGKDEKRDLYCVLDSNATQKVTISSKDLAQVRFPAGGVYPLMGQMYWIKSVPEQLPDLKPLILKSIHKTCWYMTPSCNLWDDWDNADKRKLATMIDLDNELEAYTYEKDDNEESGYACKKYAEVNLWAPQRPGRRDQADARLQ